MSSQNNMAKESYPYKIIQSGYAPSSSHKIFKSCTTQFQPSNCFILQYFSNFFNFHAIHEREPWIQHYMWNRMVVVEKTERIRLSHINQAYQRAMEMPINRYQCELVGIAMQRMHQSYKCMKAQQKKLSGCASNLLAHEDLGHFEDAHHWNIQAKFYNEKFPLVYESDIIGDSLS